MSSPPRDYSPEAYNNSYNAAKRGASWEQIQAGVRPQDEQYVGAMRQGWEAAQAEKQYYNTLSEMESMMHSAHGAHEAAHVAEVDPLSAAGTSYDEIKSELGEIESGIYGYYNNPAYVEDGDEPEMLWQVFEFGSVPEDLQYGYSRMGTAYGEGYPELESMYGDYLSAVESAQSFIDTQIQDEMNNARLLGIDYTISPEMRTVRTEDYFSTLWSEADQTSLEKLVDEWGEPEGFKGYTLARGTGETLQSETEGEGTRAGVSEGIRAVVPGDESEEGLGIGSILGGTGRLGG